MGEIVARLRTACSPESPLGKLCTEAADEIATASRYAEGLAVALHAQHHASITPVSRNGSPFPAILSAS